MTTVSQEAREAAENFMNAHGWLCEEDWSLVLEADREVIVKFFAKFEQSIRQSAERGEVVAWMYEYRGGVVAVTATRYDRGTIKALGYVETPLYTLTTPPEAVRTPIEGTSHAD